MDKQTAIAELSEVLELRSAAYYDHLAYGGQGDPSEENLLDALDFVIRFMSENEE